MITMFIQNISLRVSTSFHKLVCKQWVPILRVGGDGSSFGACNSISYGTVIFWGSVPIDDSDLAVLPTSLSVLTHMNLNRMTFTREDWPAIRSVRGGDGNRIRKSSSSEGET